MNISIALDGVDAMNRRDELVNKLKKYKEEIKQNILNPYQLVFAEEQKAANAEEHKYDCYFGYSKTQHEKL